MTDTAKTILVVDDDPEILALVKRVLVKLGHEVLTASDPRQALELVSARELCLIIADLMLPHMDGEDFLRTLERRDGGRPPVIILSASAVRDEVAARTRAEAVLAKPFQLEDLCDLVARFC